MLLFDLRPCESLQFVWEKNGDNPHWEWDNLNGGKLLTLPGDPLEGNTGTMSIGEFGKKIAGQIVGLRLHDAKLVSWKQGY